MPQSTISLPIQMRGHINYVVVLHPADGRTYSIGIKYVGDTVGAHELIRRLMQQHTRKHKKPHHANLCPSVVCGTMCGLGKDCPSIHINPAGFENMRTWDRPIRIPQRNASTNPEPSSKHDTSSESDGLSSSSSSECLRRHVKRDTVKTASIPTYTVHRPYDGCLMTVIETNHSIPPTIQSLSQRSDLKTARYDGYLELPLLTQTMLSQHYQNGRIPCRQSLGISAPSCYKTINQERSPNTTNSLNAAHGSMSLSNWADYPSDTEMDFLSDDE